jgi:chromosome partitioning protein
LARIIAIANQKGGVGKTTTAINLAGSLAEQGFQVLCVDMDPQANLTVGLGINLRTVERSMAEALIDDNVRLEDIVIPTQTAGVDVAPATIDLSASENVLFSSIGREQALRDVLQRWATDHYDYIMIYCPPTHGLLTNNSLEAANCEINPVQTQYYALTGFAALVNVITQIRTKGLNPELTILGLLATFFDGRTLLARDMLQELRDLGDHHIFENMIKQTVRLGEAPLVGRPITAYATNSDAARIYRGLAREVIELG